MSDNNNNPLVDNLINSSKELLGSSNDLVKRSKQLSKHNNSEELDQLVREAAMQAVDIIERTEAILMAIQYLKK
jgi:hypothetical protein